MACIFFYKYNYLQEHHEHSASANLCPDQVYYANEEVINLILKKGKVT